eukprot:2148634-Pleurochrysis_carterae.AAC.1
MTQTKLSKQDYYTMIDTCNQLDVHDFRDYHDLYLKIDVFALVDVCESYRTESIEAYGGID